MTTFAALIEQYAATQMTVRTASARGDENLDVATTAHVAARSALCQALGVLGDLQARLLAYDLNMGMSGGDESQARPPTGDDYNNIMDDVRATLANLIGQEAPELVEA